MTTITINTNTKAGKSLLEIAKNFSAKDSGITISEDVAVKQVIEMANPKDKVPNAQAAKAMHNIENSIGPTTTIDFKVFMDNVNS